MITFKYNNLPHTQEQSTSELWSWFLSNLSAGLFENITKDNVKFQKLIKFFDEFIIKGSQEDSGIGHSNFIMLLLPTIKLNKNPSFLIGLVSKFFNALDGMKHDVTITPVGSIQALEATIIMVHDRSVEAIQQKTQGEEELSSIISNLNGVHLNNINAEQPQIEQPQISSEYDDDESIVSTVNNLDDSLYGESLIQYPTRISSLTLTDDEEFTNNDCLILKSILYKDSETNELKTAIRQLNNEDDSNNEENNIEPVNEEGVTQDEDNDEWLVYDEQFSLNNLELLSLKDITCNQYNDPKLLFYTLQIAESYNYDNEEDGFGDDHEDLDNDSDLEVMEFQGNVTFHTDTTTPLFLTKTNTLNTFKSVRSELLVHNPDGTYSNIVKSKSEPLSSGNRVKKLGTNRKHLNKKASCVIM